MPVVKVGIMRMAVDQAPMDMGVDMRLSERILGTVGMLVMFIVNMGMRMVERFVDVLMIMPLDQVQPKADPHQHCGYD